MLIFLQFFPFFRPILLYFCRKIFLDLTWQKEVNFEKRVIKTNRSRPIHVEFFSFSLAVEGKVKVGRRIAIKEPERDFLCSCTLWCGRDEQRLLFTWAFRFGFLQQYFGKKSTQSVFFSVKYKHHKNEGKEDLWKQNKSTNSFFNNISLFSFPPAKLFYAINQRSLPPPLKKKVFFSWRRIRPTGMWKTINLNWIRELRIDQVNKLIFKKYVFKSLWTSPLIY